MRSSDRIIGRIAYGGVLLVPVELNGFGLRFMVDTGAADCAIALDQVVAEPTPHKVVIAPIGTELVTASTLRINDFVVGGRMQKNVLVTIVDLPAGFQLDGLIGMNFLGKYRFTIEPDTATLILRDIPIKKTK